MSIITSLATNQKRDPSGAPFAAGSADNGLSVDAVTGRIVLGNDQNDPAQPAVLLNSRDIPLNGNQISFIGTNGLAYVSILEGDIDIAKDATSGTRPALNLIDLAGSNSSGISFDGLSTIFDFNGAEKARFLSTSHTNRLGLGVNAPTATLHLKAGTIAAGTAPWKYNSGPLLTTAEVGANEFLTDKAFLTITTGAARKEYTLNDIALTAGRVPFVTTNGRLTDNAALTFGTSANGQSLQISGSITSATPVAAFTLTQTWNNAGAAPIGLSMLITDTASQTFNSSLQRAVVNGTTVWNVRKDGALTTGDPGGGAGIWKLGEPTAGAVVLDLANYVEVEINGNIVKLLIST